MQLYVNVIPVKAGSSDPVDESEMVDCPPDVEGDSVLSFLMQQFGEPIEMAYMSNERHPRLEIGWVFPGQPCKVSKEATELFCIPNIRRDDGSFQPMFEALADQRELFEELAKNGTFSEYVVATTAQREYMPSDEDSGTTDNGEEERSRKCLKVKRPRRC